MRRRLLFFILIVGLGFIVARARRAILEPEPDRDPWSTEPPVVLEALPRKYFDAGHIPTARVLPLGEIARALELLVEAGSVV